MNPKRLDVDEPGAFVKTQRKTLPADVNPREGLSRKVVTSTSPNSLDRDTGAS